MKVAVLGGGALGRVMSGLVKRNGIDCGVFDIVKNGVVDFDSSLECVSECDVVLVCVPSFVVRKVISDCSKGLKSGCVVVNCAKGLEPETHKFLTDVISEELEVVGLNEVVSVGELSGPAIASEIADDIHTKVNLVVESDDGYSAVCKAVETEHFKCVRSSCLHAVELGGVMKNVYALICGIIDGVCKNTNTKAFVMTEGLSEMFVLGEKLGYSKDVFVGLSGLGDLLTTCMSEHSRNNRFGQMMAKGMDVQEAMDEMGMVVEGYYTTKVLKEWADEVGVELPLLNLLYEFLYEKMEVDEFMGKIINCGIFN